MTDGIKILVIAYYKIQIQLKVLKDKSFYKSDYKLLSTIFMNVINWHKVKYHDIFALSYFVESNQN